MTTTDGIPDWLSADRVNWDRRVPIHTAGSFYDLPAFVTGRSALAGAGLRGEFLHEHDHGHFRPPAGPGVPRTYSLRASKAR